MEDVALDRRAHEPASARAPRVVPARLLHLQQSPLPHVSRHIALGACDGQRRRRKRERPPGSGADRGRRLRPEEGHHPAAQSRKSARGGSVPAPVAPVADQSPGPAPWAGRRWGAALRTSAWMRLTKARCGSGMRARCLACGLRPGYRGAMASRNPTPARYVAPFGEGATVSGWRLLYGRHCQGGIPATHGDEPMSWQRSMLTGHTATSKGCW